MTTQAFTPLGAFSGGNAPVMNVAPFTYGDAITYLRMLMDLQTTVNNAIATLNSNNTILNAFQSAISAEIDAQNNHINTLGASLVSYTVTNVGSNVLQLVFQDGSTTQIYNTNGVAGQLDPINTDISQLQGNVQTLQTDWSNLDTTVGDLVTTTTSHLYAQLQSQTAAFVTNSGAVQTAITNLIQTLMNATTANNAQNSVRAFVEGMATSDSTFSANVKNLIIGWLGSFSDSLAYALRQRSRLILNMETTQGYAVTQTSATNIPSMSGSFTSEANVKYKITISVNVTKTDATDTPIRIGVYIDNQGISNFPTIVNGIGTQDNLRLSSAATDYVDNLVAGNHTIDVRAYIDSGNSGWTVNWAHCIVEVL